MYQSKVLFGSYLVSMQLLMVSSMCIAHITEFNVVYRSYQVSREMIETFETLLKDQLDKVTAALRNPMDLNRRLEVCETLRSTFEEMRRLLNRINEEEGHLCSLRRSLTRYLESSGGDMHVCYCNTCVGQ